MIGDDGDIEWPCKHGVGHSEHVHTCDGCCDTAEFYQDCYKHQRKCVECGNPISFHKMDCSRPRVLKSSKLDKALIPRCPKCGSYKLSCRQGHTWEIPKEAT